MYANTCRPGTITQWGEVSKVKKDRSRSKAKDSVTTTIAESTSGPRVSRNGRGGHEGGRGSRGRGTERGRGSRGRSSTAVHTNGTRTKDTSDLSVPTEDSTTWNTAKKDDASETLDTSKPSNDTWSAAAADAASTTAAAAASVTSSIIPDGVKKSWASMFKAAPAPKKEPPSAEKYVSIPVFITDTY